MEYASLFAPRHIASTIRSVIFSSMRHVQHNSWIAPKQLRDLYLPSLQSFFFIAIALSLLFVLPKYRETLTLSSDRLLAGLSDGDTAKKIFDGLAVIAVALIIFVAESIRETENPDQKRILLRASYLWPLTLIVTLFPIGYLTGTFEPYTAILIVGIILFAIYAFAAILRILLDNDASERSLKSLLKDRIHSYIMSSARERIGNNIFLGLIGDNREVEASFVPTASWIRDRDGYIIIDHDRTGWITDINIHDLRSIVRLVKAENEKLERIETQVSRPSQHFTERRPGSEKSAAIYLLKKLGDRIQQNSPFSPSERSLLAIRKDLTRDTTFLSEVRRRASQAYQVSEANPPSFGLRRETKGIKDRLITAIRNNSTGSVDDLRQTYLEIAEEFLKTLHELGGGYTADQARSERSDFFGGWNEIRWLSQDLYELLSVATASDSIEIVGNIAFLPFAIATRAVTAHDHLLFQSFTPFANHIYYLSRSKSTDSRIREYMADRSWRYLKELFEFYILPFDLQRGGEPIDIKESSDFAVYALKVFQDLLKATYDQNDLKSFEVILGVIDRLFRQLPSVQDTSRSAFLREHLRTEGNEERRSQIEEQLSRAEAAEKASQRLHLARLETIFGMASHILDRKANRDSVEDTKFFGAIQDFLPNSIEQLTRAFEKATAYQSSDHFDWTRWDMQADGEAHFVDTTTKPDRLFSLAALRILAKAPELKHVEIPPSEAIRGFLSRIGDGLRNRAAELGLLKGGMLSETEAEQIDNLERLLKDAQSALERREEDELIATPISPKKVTDFRSSVIETCRQAGHLRQLMSKLGALKFEEFSRQPEIPSWGFNQLDDKGAFIENYRVSYPTWGAHYGRGLAQGEDKYSFEAMVTGTAKQVRSTRVTLLDEIEEAIDYAGLENPIIVHSFVSYLQIMQLDGTKRFIPKFDSKCPSTELNDIPGYSGALLVRGKYIPIIAIFIADQELRRKLLVADFEKFARFVQYNPASSEDEDRHVEDAILISIRDLNLEPDLISEIMRDQPQYLSDIRDKERYLRTRVIVKVLEKFGVEFLDRSAGVAFEVIDIDE